MGGFLNLFGFEQQLNGARYHTIPNIRNHKEVYIGIESKNEQLEGYDWFVSASEFELQAEYVAKEAKDPNRFKAHSMMIEVAF